MTISADTRERVAKFLNRQSLQSKPSDILELCELLNSLVQSTPPQSELIIKGSGNTGESVEDGDYRFITNPSNQIVIQYYTSGSWDTDNETILATPS